MNNNKVARAVPKLKADATLDVIYGSDTEQDMILAVVALEDLYQTRPVDGIAREDATPIQEMPRFLVNGFPKSGLHMLSLYMLGMAMPNANKPWISSWYPSPWHTDFCDFQFVEDALTGLLPGESIKGHLGYTPQLRELLERERYGHIFIYRNLRDVAVSAAHHVLTPDEHQSTHPDKAYYRGLPDLEAVIIAIIEGTDEFPGLIERWRYYLPWLVDDRTLAISYEYCLKLPGQACRDILAYRYRHSAMWHELEVKFDEDKLLHAGQMLARHAQATHMSATYRAGKAGAWREVWTDEIERAFRRAGGHVWDAKEAT